MVGDIKARHPGITPGRFSVCKPSQDADPGETDLLVAPGP